MKLFQNGMYDAERAVLEDAIGFENATVVIDEPYAAVVRLGRWSKCVFADASDYSCYAEKYGLIGDVCLLGAPAGIADDPCITYTYLKAMPPLPLSVRGMAIKRLAPSLSGVVFDAYSNPGGGCTVEHIAALMRDKGVFGAIYNGVLAGFIGRHIDGSMGMLEVFPQFRRRGVAAELEKFLITYVMTFGRVPFCDVFTDNSASIALQDKLGLTKSNGFTYWLSADKD